MGTIDPKLKNAGAISTVLPEHLVQRLKQLTAEMIRADFEGAIPKNAELAGHIVHSYKFDHCKDELTSNINLLAGKKYKLDSLWVNFQKKHEFNPVHMHTGDLSFVLWLTIPYTAEQEFKGPGKHPRAGQFEFICLDTAGRINPTPIPVDNTWDGTLCIFPSKLPHCVYPFYSSDDYRVTIAGNLSYFSN